MAMALAKSQKGNSNMEKMAIWAAGRNMFHAMRALL
jgi:hypothetical protein